MTIIETMAVYGPAGLKQRQAPPGASCPIWCESPHDCNDDADYHHGAYTMVPMYKTIWIHDGKTDTEYGCEARVGLEQHEKMRHPVVIFEGSPATWMTAGEADNFATILRDFVTDMRKATAERAEEPVWCNQEHAPGDGHHSKIKTVYLTAYGEFHARELLVAALQPPKRRAYIEVCNAWHGDTATHLLAHQAERIADALAMLSLAVRLHEGAAR